MERVLFSPNERVLRLGCQPLTQDKPTCKLLPDGSDGFLVEKEWLPPSWSPAPSPPPPHTHPDSAPAELPNTGLITSRPKQLGLSSEGCADTKQTEGRSHGTACPSCSHLVVSLFPHELGGVWSHLSSGPRATSPPNRHVCPSPAACVTDSQALYKCCLLASVPPAMNGLPVGGLCAHEAQMCLLQTLWVRNQTPAEELLSPTAVLLVGLHRRLTSGGHGSESRTR